MTHPLNIALKYLFEYVSPATKSVNLYLFIINTNTEKVDYIHCERDWERFYHGGEIDFYCANDWERFYRNNTKRQSPDNEHDTEYIKLCFEYLTGERPFCKRACVFQTTAFVSEKIAFPLALELTKWNPFFEEFFNLSQTVRKVEIEKKKTLQFNSTD